MHGRHAADAFIFTKTQQASTASSLTSPPSLRLLTCVFSLHLAKTIVLYDTANPLDNNGAPRGTCQNRGWGWQGNYGSFLGTMIGEQNFISAQHVGVQGTRTFVSRAGFNGVGDVSTARRTAELELASGTSLAQNCGSSKSTRPSDLVVIGARLHGRCWIGSTLVSLDEAELAARKCPRAGTARLAGHTARQGPTY